MIAKKNKILILLDGSEDSEKSLDFIINSKIVKFDQIVLFFILNPFNPVTKGQDKEVLYNDFVHDHGKRLATLYIEKIENFINSKDLGIELSHNIVNSKDNLQRRLSLGDIDLTICSINVSNNLDFIFNKSKVINYLMGTSSDILIFPSDYNFSLEHKNNLILNFSESIKPKYFVDTHNILDIDKFSILYSKNDKNNVEKLLEEIDKNFQVEIFQNNKSNLKNIYNMNKNFNFLRQDIHKKNSLFSSMFISSRYNSLSNNKPLYFKIN